MDQSVSSPDAKSTPQPASQVPRAVPPVGILPRVSAGRRAGIVRAHVAAKAAGLTLQGVGITPDSLEAIAPQYLWRFRASGQFQHNGV